MKSKPRFEDDAVTHMRARRAGFRLMRIRGRFPGGVMGLYAHLVAKAVGARTPVASVRLQAIANWIGDNF
jgi:hypothetical protein